MKVSLTVLILILLLSACTTSTTNVEDNLISQQEAMKIAQRSVGDRDAEWSAVLVENVWNVEATFPAGNKETYLIDATNCKILVLTEVEAPSKDI